jgi:hypothetical protein
MKRVLFSACVFSACAWGAAVAQPPRGVEPDSAREIDAARGPAKQPAKSEIPDRPVLSPQRIAELKRELRLLDPTGAFEARLKEKAEAEGTTLEAMLARWADPAEQRAAAARSAERVRKLAASNPILYEIERRLAAMDMTDPKFFRAVDAVADSAGISSDEVITGISDIYALSHASGTNKDHDQPASVAPEQQTRLRHQGAAGNQASNEQLRQNGLKEQASGGYRGHVARRLAAAAEWKRRAQEQQAANNAVLAQAAAQQQAGIHAMAAQRQQWQNVQQPRFFPYVGPYYENISQAGNQAFINGAGPYGLFNETISRTGNQTFISGYGAGGPFNETIQHSGNQTFINGFGPYGPFSETIQQSGGQTFVSGFGMPPIGYPAYGYGGFGAGY